MHGREAQAHLLELVSPVAQWEAATGLAPLRVGRRGFGTYLAADYDELVDCPVEMGTFWSAEFKAAGMNDHIGKPFKRDELLLAVERWRGRRSDWLKSPSVTAA